MLTCRFLDRNPEPLRTPLPVSASFSVRMAPGRSCRADRPGTAVPAEGGDPCFWLCSGERLALGAPEADRGGCEPEPPACPALVFPARSPLVRVRRNPGAGMSGLETRELAALFSFLQGPFESGRASYSSKGVEVFLLGRLGRPESREAALPPSPCVLCPHGEGSPCPAATTAWKPDVGEPVAAPSRPAAATRASGVNMCALGAGSISGSAPGLDS